MTRRNFLKATPIVLPTIITSINAAEYTTVEKQFFPTNLFKLLFGLEKEEEKKVEKKQLEVKKKIVEKPKKELEKIELVDIERDSIPLPKNEEIVSKEQIVQNAKKPILTKDVFLEDKYIESFVSVRKKLKFIQSYVGYGNFNIISFDEMLSHAKRSPKIEAFTKLELEFLESIFYYDPKHHGFYGERITTNITQKINRRDVNKIPRTGHFLFKGEPEKIYNQMLTDVGDSLILTSGVRSIVKQTKLFLDKLDSSEGNLSVASKSLAPPAFTYHSVADFDVGKKGFGHANFSPRFALTQEFLKMRKLKYIDMRYTINNKDGVRYEPWHVKII